MAQIPRQPPHKVAHHRPAPELLLADSPFTKFVPRLESLLRECRRNIYRHYRDTSVTRDAPTTLFYKYHKEEKDPVVLELTTTTLNDITQLLETIVLQTPDTSPIITPNYIKRLTLHLIPFLDLPPVTLDH